MKVCSLFAAALVGATLLSGCSSPCRQFTLHEAEPGVFVGCRPKRQADFATLRHCGIRTILSLETFTWHIVPERRDAARNQLAFRNVPIFASPFAPSEQSVKAALLVLNEASLRPIYLHCYYGRDRAAMLLGLYRIYYEGWSAEEAWQDMLRTGYKHSLSMWGFQRYFWHHTQRPDWARARSVPPHAPAPARQPASPPGRGKEKGATPSLQSVAPFPHNHQQSNFSPSKPPQTPPNNPQKPRASAPALTSSAPAAAPPGSG